MRLFHFAEQPDYSGATSGMVAVAVAAIAILAQRRRGRKRILITDYRCGVRFVNGEFTAVLPAGSYTYNPERDQISIIDMRPQPILIERQNFQDASGTPAIIRIGTELIVRDPHRAAIALRDQIKDAYVIVRDTLRSTLARQIVGGIGDSRNSIESVLSKFINDEFGKVGMGVSEILVTGLWVATPVMPAGAPSGVVQ